MSIERSLIEHCSPTLASLKVGSLFCILSSDRHALLTRIRELNGQLHAKGLTLRLVRMHENRGLCYLYRTSHLEKMLADERNAAFLTAHGYDSLDPGDVLETLCSKLEASADFPHEIGLFLGYPLGDVIGFIENKGKNCLCCGCWKAYTDACAAQKTFARFSKCTRVYKKLYQAGRSLNDLTVAA